MIKTISISLAVLVAVLIGYQSYSGEKTNLKVAEELRTNPSGERAQRVMLITLADGRTFPVNYLHEENTVFMGIDGRWWREFVGDGQGVTLLIKGKTLNGHAKTVLDQPQYIADVFSRLRPKVPNWLPSWLNGKLVVITLQK